MLHKGNSAFWRHGLKPIADFISLAEALMPSMTPFESNNRKILFGYLKNKCIGATREILHRQGTITTSEELKAVFLSNFGEKEISLKSMLPAVLLWFMQRKCGATWNMMWLRSYSDFSSKKCCIYQAQFQTTCYILKPCYINKVLSLDSCRLPRILAEEVLSLNISWAKEWSTL